MEQLLEKAALSEVDRVRWESFLSPTRRREWLTVRLVVKDLLPGGAYRAIRYDDRGKPHLPEQGISISHSNEFIAVMVSGKKHLGIDIEEIGTRIERLSQKFLSENEKQYAFSARHVEKLHVMWGAKETLFKIHGIGHVDFKNDLYVHPFIYTGSGYIRASILKKGYEKDYTVNYHMLGDYMLAWAVEE
jgi:phosphopantetheinyl transferase